MGQATQTLGSVIDALWLNALAAVPVALAAAVLCRHRWCRPATRHWFWLAVLGALVVPALALGALKRADLDAGWRAALGAADRIGAEGRRILDAAGGSLPAQSADRSYTRPDAPPEPPPVAIAPLEQTGWRGMVSLGNEPVRAPRAVLPATTPDAASARSPAGVLPAPGLIPPAPEPPPALATDAGRGPSLTGAPAVAVGPVPPASAGESPRAPGLWVLGAAVRAVGEQLRAQVRDWSGHAATLRAALVDLPPIPPAIWLAGLGAALLWRLVQFVAARRVLRSAVPAPEGVNRMVADAAGLVGLKHPPRVLMTDRRVSPMVWCAGPARLVLPTGLWRALDTRSRRTVLVHELAHLKRRDHWVWRVSLVVGAVYWWHPVAWWATRRLRDEADASCDAWVTSLLPASRRAYAEALLAAQSYVVGPRLLPLPALSMASSRTRRLSRRLTMVMTDCKAPRSSIAGLALAAAIAVGGLLVAPALACPPEEKDKANVTLTSDTPCPPEEKEEKSGTRTTSAAAPRAAMALLLAGQGAQPDPRAADMQRLMERLERMEARLNDLSARLGETPSRAAVRGEAPPVIEVQPERLQVRSRVAVAPQVVVTPKPDTGATETRTYRLPEGKLRALWDLMAREDVPIWVHDEGDSIGVEATPEQHRVLRAFIDMIHPDGASRSDAGVILEHAAAAELARAGAHEAHAAELARAMALKDRAQAEAHAVHAREMQRHLHLQAQELRRQAEMVNKEADRLRDQADRIRKQAEQMREKADKANDEGAREGLHSAADQTEAQADAVEEQAEAFEEQAEAFEEQAEAIEEQAEAMAEELETAAVAPRAGGYTSSPTRPALAPAPATPAVPAVPAVPAAAPASPAPPAPAASTGAR